ncbi:hypothetical protein ebA6694 [Aromatoleum aromaticum EbN1]|uniref:Uncharacterized protein n=1 Tax=Aromatoleum aromaticum (strain DSM 19018 / LMG 30748 / EbN1) TaxID=76114 RepID=Q5NYB0_AROAE|nr:hypothetical protein ebA6694 [Aromatoleum aromaticum EbN1]
MIGLSPAISVQRSTPGPEGQPPGPKDVKSKYQPCQFASGVLYKT